MAHFRMDESLYARIQRYIEENWVPEAPEETHWEEFSGFAAGALYDMKPGDFFEAGADAVAYEPEPPEEAPPPLPSAPPPAPKAKRAAGTKRKKAREEKETGSLFSVRKRRKTAMRAETEPEAFHAPAPNIMGLHLAEEDGKTPFPEDYAATVAPNAAARPDAMYSVPALDMDADWLDLSEDDFPLEETFPQAVLRLIDEKGMTDPQCYNRANLSRAVFNKLKQSALNPGGAEYRPSKETALALTIGLGLTLDEAKNLLEKAGFALSHCSRRDLIVEYFLAIGNHDIFELNEALFRFQQQPLGSF